MRWHSSTKPLEIAVVRSSYEFSGVKRYLETFSYYLVTGSPRIRLTMLVHPRYLIQWPKSLTHERIVFPFRTRVLALLHRALPVHSNLFGIAGIARVTKYLHKVIVWLLRLREDTWRSKIEHYLASRKSTIDVVYYCQPTQTDVLRTKDIPSVCLWVDFSEDRRGEYADRLRDSYKYWFLHSSAVVFLTESIRKRALELAPELAEKRTLTISVPAWLASPTPGAVDAVLSALPQDPGVLYVLVPGRANERKMQHLLVEAIPTVNGISGRRLVPVFCGPGTENFDGSYGGPMDQGKPQSYTSYVGKLADECGLKWGRDIVAMGLVGEEELAALYRLSHLCVFPSRYEGLGLPLFEAMQSGLPVVCSDIPVFRNELEGRGLGVSFFKSGSASSLAGTLCSVIRDWDGALAQAEKNRVIASRVTPETFAAEYRELFETLVGKPKVPAHVTS